MRFLFKRYQRNSATSAWDSDDFDETIKQDNKHIDDSDDPRKDMIDGRRSRLSLGQKLMSSVRNYQLVDKAFETMPALPQNPSLAPYNDFGQSSLEATPYRHKRGVRYATTTSGAIQMERLPAELPQSKSTMTVPRTAHKKASDEMSILYPTDETVLIDQLHAQGFKVHHLDYVTLSGPKEIRRHYWMTPISSDEKPVRSKLVDDLFSRLRDQNSKASLAVSSSHGRRY